jgi:hypothetical protein
VHEGLPPGPIANPGAAPIEATGPPAHGAWLFWGLGGWWIAGAVVCALVAMFGVVGFFSDLQKKPRKKETSS